MKEFLGYIVLILTIVAAILIVYYTQNYFNALLCLWVGITVSSMMILHFKPV
jgi:hypothetical protein